MALLCCPVSTPQVVKPSSTVIEPRMEKLSVEQMPLTSAPVET